MRRGRGGARKAAMASSSRLSKRRHRSSCTSSREDDGGVKFLQETVAAMDEMEMKDLEFLARNKRRRSDMSLHVCDEGEEGRETNRAGGCGEGESEVEHGEVTRESKDKSPTEMVSSNQRSLKCVIGALVPRKARSAFTKRSPQEYPASGCNNHNSSETAQKTAESKIQNGKAIKLSGSVDDDMEMEEVAEVLFSLMRQSHQPDTARDSQQRPLVLDVKKLEHIEGDGDVEVCSWENNVEQGGKSEGSLLEIVQKDVKRVGLENAETLIEDDWLVKGIKKEKSSSHMVYGLASESRNYVAMKANQMAPLVECKTGNLEIDFMVSPSESYSKLVQGRKRSPRDDDVNTIGRTKEHMSEVSVGKQEKFLIDMRSLSVPIDVTSLQLQRSYWNPEATEAAYITSSSVAVSKELCRKMGYTQPREALSYMGMSSSPFTSRKLSQDGWKRCATHYHIAESITRVQQYNNMNCLSSASGSSCSMVNAALSVKKDVNERPTQRAILRGNNLAYRASNVADSTTPRKNETAIEASSCLPDLAQRKQHLNHKAPNVSSSVTEKIVPAPAFHASQYQMMGLNSECSRIPVSASSVQTAKLSKNATGAGAVASSGFSMMDPAMSFCKSHLVANEAPPFMTIIPTNEYAFSIPSPVGSSASFKGVHGHAMPHFNGFMHQPEMFYPHLPLRQQPHRHTPILPSGQTTGTRLSHLSSRKQPQQHQQHGPNVAGHNLFPASNVNSRLPLMQHMQSSHQSCKSEVEVPDKKPSVANNWSAYSQHGLPPFQQLNFTMMPMVSGNGNPRKVETREPNQEPMVGVEHPTSQPFSMSYSTFGAIKGAPGINFSFPTQNLPFFPSLPEIAHQRYFVPNTGDVVSRKNYKVGAKSGIDFRVADSARKSVTGKSSSYVNHPPAFSRAIPHDQKDMMKELGIFDSYAKTPRFNAASDGNPQNHHGPLQQQHAQGIWTNSPAMNGQPSASMSTNVSDSPVLISHPANCSSARMPIPQSTSTVPTFTKNPPNQVISSHCPTQRSYGGNNVKSVAVQGGDMSIMQSHSSNMARICQSSSPKSSQSSSRGIKSGSAVASPTG